MKKVVRVLLCDDRPLVRARCRETLTHTPGVRVVGEADGGYAGIGMVLQLRPDLVVMDVDMPDLDGIEATREILARAPDTRVLAFSAGYSSQIVQEMFSAGASGYLVKDGDPDELVEAIHTVMAGRPYLSARVRQPSKSGLDHEEASDPGEAPDKRGREAVQFVLVDDSSIVRERIAEVLSQLEGIEIAGQAADLATGTRLVRECRPDVLILDVDLLGQNGIDLLETAKVMNRAILVIMLTNHDHPMLRQRCAQLGADFFFHKSTEFEKVFDVCRALSERRSTINGSGHADFSPNASPGGKNGNKVL